MGLSAGVRIGVYEVIEPLGEGGMGQVWKARDTRLLRDVAIKVLPDAVVLDHERLARFERESQILAALNHPHIATAYGLEEIPSGRALIMELIAGPTLAERIAQGPLAVDEALLLARDVADALDAAHDRGVVHRDLKPANLKLSADGRVKVLDFGLAMVSSPASEPRVTESPTAAIVTLAGTVLGTVAYMSPEQARGQPVDRRTDVWAFGCVLYEMLTGRRTFDGHSVPDVIADLIRSDPDWSLLPGDTPPTVRRLLDRCLRKNAAQRLSDLGDVRLALDDVIEGREVDFSSPSPVTAKGSGLRAHAAWAATVIAVAALGAWAALHARDARPAAALRKLEVITPDLLTDSWTRPSLAPDGGAIAYGAANRLWIRRLDALEPREVPGSQRGESPFWSPDGQQLAFAARGKLWRVARDAGEATAVCDLPATGRILSGVWRPDDVMVFSAWQDSIYQVPSKGGDPHLVLRKQPEEVDFHELSLLPDGDTILLVPHEQGAEDLSHVEALRHGKRIVVVSQQPGIRFTGPRFSPAGFLLYERLGSNEGIWAVLFSADTLKPGGEPFRVAPGGRAPSVAADGTLAYARGATRYEIAWTDRAGTRLSALGSPIWDLSSPRLSPDGTRVAVAATDNPSATNDRHIWIYDAATGRRARLDATTARTSDNSPVWSPGGDVLVWMQSSTTMLVGCRVTQCITPRQLGPVWGRVSVSPLGALAFARRDAANTLSLWTSPLAADLSSMKPSPLIGGPSNVYFPSFSPDGRFIAYTSDETGRDEVYLRRFPLTDERWGVTTGGGVGTVWNRAGTEIYFRRTDGGVAVVPIALGTKVVVGDAQLLFGAAALGEADAAHSIESSVDLSRGWDVTPDGQRFLVVARVGDSTSGRLVVVQNWLSEFRR